ncbi:Uncharacterized phage protein gp47/JayE [Granulicatella balaenopterae]|uniref:Uncharacterized phage protein gp47/JayE n=1 Tax=Granulicatella balaenopterae TaxID=137733 RepID=A0A1H9IK85_9LACT|nr:baseplate J/gp47 family protein [Granulicatella balaenopterae]SEQ74976.1 Uncharacterized phage protein gp47/JayE [Granulicatella balaenopterae]
MTKGKEYTEILDDMLNRFDDKYDKRQGSILYNLVAPAAQEVAIQYTALTAYEDINFLDTSYGEYLTRLCRQFGVERLPATAAIRVAEFEQEIPIGTRFSVIDSKLNFRVLERKSGLNYNLIAEQPGRASNYVRGELINIDAIKNFEGAEIGRVIVPGEDLETDEQLRKRTIEYIHTPTLNGNVAQYKAWAKEFKGVGGVLVESLWNGPNTVKLSIVDSDGDEASPELVQKFQRFIDPEPKGHGLGVAPIGAFVTVASVQGFAITIECTIKIAEDADVDYINDQAEDDLKSYLKLEAFKEKEVRTYKVATIIDRIDGVLDVDDLLINGQNASLTLSNTDLPRLDEVTLNVAG